MAYDSSCIASMGRVPGEPIAPVPSIAPLTRLAILLKGVRLSYSCRTSDGTNALAAISPGRSGSNARAAADWPVTRGHGGLGRHRPWGAVVSMACLWVYGHTQSRIAGTDQTGRARQSLGGTARRLVSGMEMPRRPCPDKPQLLESILSSEASKFAQDAFLLPDRPYRQRFAEASIRACEDVQSGGSGTGPGSCQPSHSHVSLFRCLGCRSPGES